jgi:hypothetical protein
MRGNAVMTNKYPRGDLRRFVVRNRGKGCFTRLGQAKAHFATEQAANSKKRPGQEAYLCPAGRDHWHLRTDRSEQ